MTRSTRVPALSGGPPNKIRLVRLASKDVEPGKTWDVLPVLRVTNRLAPALVSGSHKHGVLPMAISSAVQKGTTVTVYDERGFVLFIRGNCQLVGYTSTTVSVKMGKHTYTYDARGFTMFSR